MLYQLLCKKGHFHLERLIDESSWKCPVCGESLAWRNSSDHMIKLELDFSPSICGSCGNPMGVPTFKIPSGTKV